VRQTGTGTKEARTMSSAVALSTLLSAALAAAPEAPGLPAAPALALVLDGMAPPAAARLALDLDPLAGDPGAAALGDPVAARVDEARARELRWWGRTLKWSTAASLVVTSTLGTMAAINQPTAFGDGRCITGNPVLGEYGCNRGLSTLHGSSGVLSVTLYTATEVLGLAAPESRGIVSEGAKPVHTVASWIALGGIVVQPILGLVAAFPQVIGKSQSLPTDPLPRNLRTVHLFIGYTTTAAYLTTAVLER
jgi:hypothetical protein